MSIFEFILRISLALGLGAAIGIEREWRQKSAGLLTNTLVSTGSAAFILLSVSITGSSGDPSRIASQIVTGIGFLGAGVIMKDGLSVRGLNTAATIWCSASVGTLVGFGLYLQAVIVALAVILSHLVLRPIGQKIGSLSFQKSSQVQTEYNLIVKCKADVENQIRTVLMQHLDNKDTLLLKSLESDHSNDPTFAVVTAAIISKIRQDSVIERLTRQLTIEEKVSKVSWTVVGTQTDA